MTVSANSRYSTSQIVMDVNQDGNDVLVITSSRQVNYVITFTYYQVRASDRIDTLAYKFYGNSGLWWVIADANPEILDWSRMGNQIVSTTPGTASPTVGYLLRVPNQA